MNIQKTIVGLLLLNWNTLALASPDNANVQTPMLPKYQQECAACHTAYPPSLLPNASWQRVMSNLKNHYGTDASLDVATVKEISQWLGTAAVASKRNRDEPAQDRITRSAWFVREHREISNATWSLAAIKSRSNCIACHTRADQGDFNERNIRIPR